VSGEGLLVIYQLMYICKASYVGRPFIVTYRHLPTYVYVKPRTWEGTWEGTRFQVGSMELENKVLFWLQQQVKMSNVYVYRIKTPALVAFA
jgi:hypothetical protein